MSGLVDTRGRGGIDSDPAGAGPPGPRGTDPDAGAGLGGLTDVGLGNPAGLGSPPGLGSPGRGGGMGLSGALVDGELEPVDGEGGLAGGKAEPAGAGGLGTRAPLGGGSFVAGLGSTGDGPPVTPSGRSVLLARRPNPGGGGGLRGGEGGSSLGAKPVLLPRRDARPHRARSCIIKDAAGHAHEDPGGHALRRRPSHAPGAAHWSRRPTRSEREHDLDDDQRHEREQEQSGQRPPLQRLGTLERRCGEAPKRSRRRSRTDPVQARRPQSRPISHR